MDTVLLFADASNLRMSSARAANAGLKGKVACVTGAGGGFGRRYSVSAVKLGACVLVVDIAKLHMETKRLCDEASPGARVEVRPQMYLGG